MKKIINILTLISLLAVLVAPTVTLAVGNCVNQACNGPVGTVPCMCGTTQIPEGLGSYYCWGAASRFFGTQEGCQSAMSGNNPTYQQIPENVPNTPERIVALAESIANWFFTGLLILATIYLVVAGYLFVMAGGNAEQVNKARNMMIQALIGVAVGLAARGLVVLIKEYILRF